MKYWPFWCNIDHKFKNIDHLSKMVTYWPCGRPVVGHLVDGMLIAQILIWSCNMDKSHLAPLALTGRSSFHKNICRARAVLLYLDLFIPDENSSGSDHVWPEFQTWAFSFSKCLWKSSAYAWPRWRRWPSLLEWNFQQKSGKSIELLMFCQQRLTQER